MNKLIFAPLTVLAAMLVPAAAPADLPQGALAPDFTTASASARISANSLLTRSASNVSSSLT